MQTRQSLDNSKKTKSFWIKFLQHGTLKKEIQSRQLKELDLKCFNKELHEKENFQTHWPKAAY
ncbi:hypothetical protein T4C_11134 [Trichinella pseudospiralis]|uniref:Uncharacterized protein n=1 Tax=Trichinella pseudospiralis TaxID=6337 RepID=A0A0V1FV50_TRIPS|nr:hypothetical protein T4D_14525 [Trichinella pseudospiralis]KRZ28711.1 hypothetical protein T4C_11134 [Trichinella pseudospiralis]